MSIRKHIIQQKRKKNVRKKLLLTNDRLPLPPQTAKRNPILLRFHLLDFITRVFTSQKSHHQKSLQRKRLVQTLQICLFHLSICLGDGLVLLLFTQFQHQIIQLVGHYFVGI
jgi:hypothetical protein